MEERDLSRALVWAWDNPAKFPPCECGSPKCPDTSSRGTDSGGVPLAQESCGDRDPAQEHGRAGEETEVMTRLREAVAERNASGLRYRVPGPGFVDGQEQRGRERPVKRRLYRFVDYALRPATGSSTVGVRCESEGCEVRTTVEVFPEAHSWSEAHRRETGHARYFIFSGRAYEWVVAE